MPDNAALRKRARALARKKGISYTEALRIMRDHRPTPPPPLAPGDAYALYGRPVGIIAQPDLPAPVFAGSWGVGDQLREIRLTYYGLRRLPHAYLLTNLPLPGEAPVTTVLDAALGNFVTAHTLGPGRPQQNRDAISLESWRAAQAAPREPTDVWLCGVRTPGTRVRVGTFEALEIPYQDGRIVFCGSRELAAEVRFDLDRPG